MVEGYDVPGTIRFLGKHVESGKPRVGVELDAPAGKNDGTVKGHQYFQCPAKHGVLTVPRKLARIADRSPTATSAVKAATDPAWEEQYLAPPSETTDRPGGDAPVPNKAADTDADSAEQPVYGNDAADPQFGMQDPGAADDEELYGAPMLAQIATPSTLAPDPPEKSFAELKAERQAAAEVESAQQKAAAEEAAARDAAAKKAAAAREAAAAAQAEVAAVAAAALEEAAAADAAAHRAVVEASEVSEQVAAVATDKDDADDQPIYGNDAAVAEAAAGAQAPAGEDQPLYGNDAAVAEAAAGAPAGEDQPLYENDAASGKKPAENFDGFGASEPEPGEEIYAAPKLAPVAAGATDADAVA